MKSEARVLAVPARTDTGKQVWPTSLLHARLVAAPWMQCLYVYLSAFCAAVLGRACEATLTLVGQLSAGVLALMVACQSPLLLHRCPHFLLL